jgi:hypothetical protein
MDLHGSELKKGVNGTGVTELHSDLGALGFAVPPAERSGSSFGSGTLAAVGKFQKGHGLPVTGVVDAATAAALSHAVATASGPAHAVAIVLNGAVSGRLADGDGVPIAGMSITLLSQQLRAQTPLGTRKPTPRASIRCGRYRLPRSLWH